jgi:hypothetical protein
VSTDLAPLFDSHAPSSSGSHGVPVNAEKISHREHTSVPCPDPAQVRNERTHSVEPTNFKTQANFTYLARLLTRSKDHVDPFAVLRK